MAVENPKIVSGGLPGFRKIILDQLQDTETSFRLRMHIMYGSAIKANQTSDGDLRTTPQDKGSCDRPKVFAPVQDFLVARSSLYRRRNQAASIQITPLQEIQIARALERL